VVPIGNATVVVDEVDAVEEVVTELLLDWGDIAGGGGLDRLAGSDRFAGASHDILQSAEDSLAKSQTRLLAAWGM
jgi:hypothetical protein